MDIKLNDSKLANSVFLPLIKRYVLAVIKEFKDIIQSVVIFGSVARNTARNDSDIDMLIMLKETNKEIDERFLKIALTLYDSEENQELIKKNINTKIFDIRKTEKGLRDNPLILLDILDHGIILYDPEEKMKNLLQDLDKKLKELKAEKIVFEDGKWCWDLKPDWKPGEIVEIKL